MPQPASLPIPVADPHQFGMDEQRRRLGLVLSQRPPGMSGPWNGLTGARSDLTGAVAAASRLRRRPSPAVPSAGHGPQIPADHEQPLWVLRWVGPVLPAAAAGGVAAGLAGTAAGRVAGRPRRAPGRSAGCCRTAAPTTAAVACSPSPSRPAFASALLARDASLSMVGGRSDSAGGTRWTGMVGRVGEWLGLMVVGPIATAIGVACGSERCSPRPRSATTPR
jgi:hypothetical protein